VLAVSKARMNPQHPAIVSGNAVRGQRYDVLVVGAGHNGLVAALCAARSGLRVLVVERAAVIGGATRTEHPFPRAPDLPHSTGAYLLGLMPPELLATLEIEIPVLRRDPHYFLPTRGEGYLLFGSDQAELERQFVSFFSRADFEAHLRLQAELGALREDIAPTWLAQPFSIEETAERYVRPALREVFVRLCRGSVAEYLERFGFKSDLVKAMYAVTDGFSGLYGGYDTPGTGMNFLIHNMCRLPGSDGTWMIVEGGMGTVSRVLADALARHGGNIVVGEPVKSILLENGVASGVALEDDSEIYARAVLVNADPFIMQRLVGQQNLPATYNARLGELKRPGSTFKLNLALERAPHSLVCPGTQASLGPRFICCRKRARSPSWSAAGKPCSADSSQTSRVSSGTYTPRSTARSVTRKAASAPPSSCSGSRTSSPARRGTKKRSATPSTCSRSPICLLRA
jgi:phytoene dehydrogenase-like protein